MSEAAVLNVSDTGALAVDPRLAAFIYLEARLADEARGVEGGAARQVGSLDEDDIVPAEPGQPVENRAAADAAADDDRSRPVLHAPRLSSCEWSRPLRRSHE